MHTSPESPAPHAFIAAADEHDVRTLGRTRFTFLVTGKETQGHLAITELHGEAGDSALPHIHRHEDELLYILEGALTCGIGERRVRATAGAVVYLPCGVEHWFTVDVEARVLIVFHPGGCEGFYRECSEPLDGAQATEMRAVVDSARVMAIGPKYGIEFITPRGE